MADTAPIRMLRLRQVREKTGMSQSCIYRAMSDAGFPRPARIGARAVAWLESEVDEWLTARLAKRVAELQGRREQLNQIQEETRTALELDARKRDADAERIFQRRR
jgi:prophage regulatory protein